MADAARSARKAFQDIGDAAKSGGHAASEGTLNVRASLGLLDNTIRGAHGAAMADLIHLFQDSKIVMAALPLAATTGGILLLAGGIVEAVEKIREMREEHEKLAEEMTNFGTAAQNAFNALDEKLLESEKKTDELRNDHLGALRLQLELINRQSMGELEKAFDDLSKKTDVVFEKLKSHWYTLGIGSDGAKHALEQFQTQYDSLLSHGDSGQAAGLLSGTLKDAERVLELQKSAKENSGSILGAPKDGADLGLSMRAQLELKKSGVGFTEKEIAAQETLVEALRSQEPIQGKIEAIKKSDSDNAKRTAGNEAGARSAAAAREAAASMLRMGELAIAADRAVAQAQLEVRRASIEERLAVDVDFANRQYAVELAGNQAEIAALDKSGKDYQNQLKTLQDKTLELSAQHEAKLAELQAKASVDVNARALRDLEQSEREKIAATDKASAERLRAIDAALKSEEALNLQDTQHYRELLSQRVEAQKSMDDEAAKQAELAGKEEAAHVQKAGELIVAAERQKFALLDSIRRISDRARLDQEQKFANEEFAIKMVALQIELANLDRSGKDYENKLKSIQDKQRQLTQAHENEITAIQDKAQMDRNAKMMSGLQRLEDATAEGLTSVIMRHQSFAQMLGGIGDQIVAGMIKNALMSIMADDMSRERDAAKAARLMFNAGASLPFPVNIVAAPVMGAAAFASVMAFQQGTDSVPGFGTGDKVPAMLEPGEGVVPGGVMDGLRNMVRSGSMGGNRTTHVHYAPTFHVQTIDGDGVRGVLDKHSQEFTRHFEGQLRRLNH